jgi:chaperonin GroEL (HSP60 family)
VITDSKQQRQTGRQAQLSNITAARSVSDIIRTTLGPRSMLKVSAESVLLIGSDHIRSHQIILIWCS